MMGVENCDHNCVLPNSRIWFRQFLFRNPGHRSNIHVSLVINENAIRMWLSYILCIIPCNTSRTIFFLQYMVYAVSHNNIHSDAFRRPLKPTSESSILTVVCLQHIRSVISCKR